MANVTLRLDRHILYLCINLIKFLHGVILYGFFLIRCIPCIISQHVMFEDSIHVQHVLTSDERTAAVAV